MKQQEPPYRSSISDQGYVQEQGENKTTGIADIASSQAEQPQMNKWVMFAIVAVGVFMATLDSSIVNISLPAIAHYFNEPLNGSVQWVIIAYLVATAAVLLTAGRLADMVGRKPIWGAGLIIFTVCSALCGAAPSLGILILARLFQGIGGALIMAVAPVMLTSTFPGNEQGRVLGLNAINVALGVSVGPPLGGFITAAFSWRWIFYVNVPIGIIGLIATWRLLKERPQRAPSRFDPIGAILLGCGLAALTGALSFGQDRGWSSPLIDGALIVGLLSLAALPFVEGRAQNPIIVFSLLKKRVFTSSILSLVLIFLALFSVSFLLPFYFEELRGFSPEISGLLLLPMPLTLAIVAPFSGSLADRYGTRWLAAGGLTIACIGLVLISQLDVHSSFFDIVWRLVVAAFGQALFQSPNNSALMGSAPRELQGSASGFLATGRVFGQSLSIAVAGAIFAGLGGAAAGQVFVSQHVSGTQLATLQETFVFSMRVTFLVCAAISAVGIFASLVRGNDRRQKLQNVEKPSGERRA